MSRAGSNALAEGRERGNAGRTTRTLRRFRSTGDAREPQSLEARVTASDGTSAVVDSETTALANHALQQLIDVREGRVAPKAVAHVTQAAERLLTEIAVCMRQRHSSGSGPVTFTSDDGTLQITIPTGGTRLSVKPHIEFLLGVLNLEHERLRAFVAAHPNQSDLPPFVRDALKRANLASRARAALLPLLADLNQSKAVEV